MKCSAASNSTSEFVEVTVFLALFALAGLANAAKQPPPIEISAKEPVNYIGRRQTDSAFFDGALPHAVGTHHYQAFRANRAHPSEPGQVGWTYNHQPYLVYWNGHFYFQYLSNLIEEHNPPGRTLLMTSKNARQWTDPVVAFPIYSLQEIVIPGDTFVPEGTKSVMHQRMGFYVAPNGRLLTLAFYGYCASMRYSPNAGTGLGRVVREILKDGTLGPIYFIRYNRHAGFNESNTNYPSYKVSEDKGFVEACEALLADKLMSLQWWEEDRGKDGFYNIDPGDVENAFMFETTMVTSKGAGKALCYYHRPDGVVVALWKNSWTALSPDEGKTWTPISKSPTLKTVGAKLWGQRTEDGRYALVYNHSHIRGNRFPMVVITGDDGHEFDDMLCLQGEVPPRRYIGSHKNWGSQYVRGIMEANGDPPGKHLWNVYSMNKEDIWITRTRVPITGDLDEYVDEDFEKAQTEADLELWNLYIPKWAPVRVAASPSGQGKCLKLCDEEPYDYALVERVFPQSTKVTVKLDLLAKQADHGRLEIDVTDKNGICAARITLNDEGKVQVIRGSKTADIAEYPINKWLSLKIDIDVRARRFTAYIDGERVLRRARFAEKARSVQRLTIRTGPCRTVVPQGPSQTDLPDAGERTKKALYYIDNVSIQPK